MKELRAFYFYGHNDKGVEIGTLQYYTYDPDLHTILNDLENFVRDEGAAYDYEMHTKTKWYGGFDDLGWVNESVDMTPEVVRYDI